MKRPSTKRGARLGQHFLTAPAVADRVAHAAEIKKGDTVLEIGPGKGILTRALLATGARVIAIEKDSSLVTFLSEAYKEEIDRGLLTLVEADIRDIVPENLGLTPGGYILAANIPYYITGEIIRMFLSAAVQPRTIALLVQKEVAERIARSKKESLLSLSVKVYGTPHYVQTVRAGSFSPQPSVDSAILAISDISKKHFAHCTENMFFTVVRAAFSSKRKLLTSNVSHLAPKEAVLQACVTCGIPENSRAEDIQLEKWLCLAKELSYRETIVTNPS